MLKRGDAAEIGTYIAEAIDNEMSGNVIDVCPVGALTDKTFRFKQRVWFTKPVYAHRNCPTCTGNVTLWYRGDEVLRVTARKNAYNEVQEWICNTCRFETKQTSQWTIEGPAEVSNKSVISANHYLADTVKPEHPTRVALHDYKKIDDIQRQIGTGQPSKITTVSPGANKTLAEKL